jgi:hypothetical protein
MTDPDRSLLETPVPFDEAQFELDEATVVVDRDVEEATVVVDRRAEPGAVGNADDAVDATVVVERTRVRRSEPHAGGASAAAPDDVDEATIVVARAGDVEADTEPDDTEPDDEATRVVVRGESAKPPMTHPAEQIMKAPTRRDRRRPAPAPVSEDVLRTAEHGIGPGLADQYTARELPIATPAPQPVLEAGPPPTRDAEAALPSVARRSRRSAVVAIAAFATACAVTVVGLGAVAVAAVAALLG